MAEVAAAAAVLVPMFQPLINRFSSGFWREMKMNRDVEKDLMKLKRLLVTISRVLEDAERRSVSDVALRGWLSDIKDAAFDADDVVDAFQTEALRRSHLNRSVKGKVSDFFSSNNSYQFLKKMAREIKDVINKFDELAGLREKYHLKEGSPSSSSKVVLDRETCSSVIESEVYGREDDKEHIINLLVNEDVDKNLSVLPIVGLGGIGKTTLAQLVFNDTRIHEHFEMKKWVCVGENFKVKDIICAIVEVTSASTLEDAQQLLRDKAGGKKFLLVLDDVWNENSIEWKRLEGLLKCGKPGSKIIATTRDERVAQIMGTTENPYKMNVLSKDNCWDLFSTIAFGPGKAQDQFPGLIEIGKEIVEKCGRLPLAIKSLGGLLSTFKREQEWLDIRNSEIWDLKDDNILPSLRLSFDHLPSDLKQCFAYCSLFPKDRKLERLKLIQFWIAEGFIQSSREEVPVEDIGSQYFNILLERSFLQNEVINDFSGVISCKMHDLVHDLACLVSKGEFSTVQATEDKISLTGRYSSVIFQAGRHELALHIDNEAKKLRSLHIFGFCGLHITEFELGPLPLVTHLRVLDFSGIRMKVVPKLIGRLEHLRFLDISRSKIEELPKSVCRLYNLQTLNLRYCSELERLPEGIENLRSLRHLDIEGCDSLTEMPSGIGSLTSLQTLPLFIVDERCRISELQNLNSISSTSGEFRIGIRSRMDPREAKDANLGAKPKIQSLVLERMSPSFEDEEGALENLRPHPNLKHLSIKGYGGSRVPNWVGEASVLPNLKKLELRNIDRCESLPSLGQLPSLEHLELRGMRRLRRMGEEVYGDDGGVLFPALKSLTLFYLPYLEEWLVVARNGIIMFPLLEELEIWDCPKLRPVRPPSLVKLKMSYIDEESLSAEGSLQGLSRFRDLKIDSVIASASNSSTEWGGLHHLTALQKLEISYCGELMKLPEGVGHLTSLRDLTLHICPKLEQLPDGLQRLTALQKLDISYCDELTKLPEWVGDLTSLRDLKLNHCPKLEQLPDGLQRLTGLQRLHITSCDLLKSRCEKETGEDWHKIAHIPNVQI